MSPSFLLCRRPSARRPFARLRLESLERRLVPAIFLEVESNDFQSTANDVSPLPTTEVLEIMGSVSPATDEDWFSFTLTERTGVFFDVDSRETGLSTTLNSSLALFSAGGQLLDSNDDGYDFDTGSPAPFVDLSATPSGGDSSLYRDLAPGTYAIKVSSVGGTSGDYTVRVTADTNYSTTVPVFDSLPGAADTLFLDFDGHSSSDDRWATDQGAPYSLAGFDFSGNPLEYSPAERIAIRNVWRTVAEDFSPFNINVTTRFTGTPSDGVAYRMVLGSGDGAEIGQDSGILGVAYLFSYSTTTDGQDSLGFTFFDNHDDYLTDGGQSGAIVARAQDAGGTVSHEFGHALGLFHFDDLSLESPPDDVSLMFISSLGLGRYVWRNRLNVIDGIQDDMAIISSDSNSIGYRPDDHGGTVATATILTTTTDRYSSAGIVERLDDVDLFRFVGTGDTTIRIDVDDFVSNLDVQVRLLDSTGALVASNDPANSFDATITQTLTGGFYYVEVKSDLGEGESGRYTVTIDTTTDAAPQAFNDSFSTDEDVELNGRLRGLDPNGMPVTYSVITQPAHGSLDLNGATGEFVYRPDVDYHDATTPDTFTFSVNDGTLDSNVATASIIVRPIADAPAATPDLPTTAEDVATGTIIINRNAADGVEVTHFQISGITGGTLFYAGTTTQISNGTILTAAEAATGVTFTPAGDRNSPAGDVFSFLVKGATNATGSGIGPATTVAIVVSEVNDPPTAMDDPLSSIAEDSGTRVIPFADLLANDSAGPLESGQTLSITQLGNVVGGSAQIVLGNVEFSPTLNYSGPAGFTYVVSDNGTTNGANDFRTATAQVSFTVTPVNDAPLISPVNDQIVAEDTATPALGFTISDVESPVGSLLVSATSNNQTLIPDANVVLSGSGANRAVTVTPVANLSGVATITILVSDPDGGTSTEAILVTVTEVNDAPTATADPLPAIPEDSPLNIPFTTLTANDNAGPLESSQTLTITQLSSFVGGTAQIVGSTVVFSPTLNYSGPAGFTYVVSDNGTTNGADDFLTATAQVSFTVTPANDLPLISPVNDQTVPEDTAPPTLPFTISDVESPIASLTVSATSSNQTLLPDANVVLAGSGANRTITVTPFANRSGSATVTITVSDPAGGGSVEVFTVTVTEVNDPPTAMDDPLSSIAEDSGTRVIPFADLLANDNAGPLESGQTLTITQLNNVVGGSAQIVNGNVEFTPPLDYNGPASFGYVVRDNGTTNGVNDFRTATAFVSFAVTPVNDLPLVSPVDDQTIAEDTGTLPFGFSVSDVESAASSLTLSATSNNPALVPNANVVFGGSGANRTVTVTPATNRSGSAIITVTVSDPDGGSSIEVFTVTVTEVNDAPTATADPLSAIAEDSGTRVIPFAALTANDNAGPLESGQTLTITQLGNVVGGSAQIVLGSVLFTPTLNYSGPAGFVYTVSDNGTTNGADDFLTTTAQVSFTVTPANDLPLISPINDQTVAEDTPTGALPFTVSDVESPIASLTVSATSDNQTLIPNANVVLGGIGANRTITVMPAPNLFGSATVTITVSDTAGGTSTETFTVVVNSVQDVPLISDVANRTIDEDTTTGPVPFTVFDAETPADLLTLTATSSNQALVPNANVVLGGTAGNRTVTVTPTANNSGTTTITITVRDADGTTAMDTFSVVVAAVNDPPVAVADAFTVTATSSTLLNVLSNDDAAEPNRALTLVSVSAGNQSGKTSIVNGQVSYQPRANFEGVETFSYVVTDGFTTATGTVTVALDTPPLPAVVVIGTDGGPARVRVMQSDGTVSEFAPFPGYEGGVRVGVGDVTNDGVADQVVTTADGIGHVKVFDGVTGAEARSYVPFPGSSSGLEVAVGDVNQDGFADVITGTAIGSTHVVAFSGRTGEVLLSFFAFEGFLGGVRIGAGDLDGDGDADVAAVAGPGGNGHVKGFDGRTLTPLSSFLGYVGYVGEINLTIADLGVGAGRIVTTAVNPASGVHVKAVAMDGTEQLSFFSTLGAEAIRVRANFSPVARITAADLNGDGIDELILINGDAATATQVSIQDGSSLAVLSQFFAFEPQYNLGGSVAAG